MAHNKTEREIRRQFLRHAKKVSKLPYLGLFEDYTTITEKKYEHASNVNFTQSHINLPCNLEIQNWPLPTTTTAESNSEDISIINNSLENNAQIEIFDPTITRTFFDRFFNESDDDNEELLLETNSNLACKIADWASLENISSNCVNNLLLLLKDYHPDLPKDYRTLKNSLKSEFKSSELFQLSEDISYFHVGLIKNLEVIHSQNPLPLNYKLKINIDGLPCYKSSSLQLWPILGQVNSFEPFLIGASCGKSKPPLQEYLKQLILELKALITTTCATVPSISISNITIVADSPARSFIKQIKSHTGYYGCDGCQIEGTYLNNRMVFLEMNAPLRTDSTFLCEENNNHLLKNGLSPFCEIPNFPMVSAFPRDPMHNLFLGVTRRLIMYWIKGHSKPAKLNGAAITSLSLRMSESAMLTPKEFPRKPRSLREVDRFKATEFRSFLLYLGSAILKGILSEEVYNHFMMFSCAIRILSSNASPDEIDFADNLLRNFVRCSVNFYGDTFTVYNVHSLIHISSDVKLQGPLENYSAFPFESFLFQIKRSIAGAPKNPLKTLKNKVDEGFFLRRNCRDRDELKSELGPTICISPNYSEHKYLIHKCGYISNKNGNSYCITKDKLVIEVMSIMKNNISGNVIINAKNGNQVTSLCEYPFPSSKILMFKVNFSESLEIPIKPEDIICKCYGIKLSDEFMAVLPIIHSQ